MQISTDLTYAVARRSPRVLFVLGLGPACVLGGFVWALLQPYRITLFHPYGQGFWWLVSQPPLYVVLVGTAFHLLIAPSVLEDLEPAAAALKKLPPDEATQVAAWLLDIAKAVAASAKTVNPDEQATIDKLAALFGVPAS